MKMVDNRIDKVLERLTSKEREIELMKFYMDKHLDLLNQAIEEENKKEMKFQMEKLNTIRVRLTELGYFKERK